MDYLNKKIIIIGTYTNPKIVENSTAEETLSGWTLRTVANMTVLAAIGTIDNNINALYTSILYILNKYQSNKIKTNIRTGKIINFPTNDNAINL